MSILEIRILPPIAIGRLGGASEPMEAFDLVVPEGDPLGYRKIVPQPTFIVDATSGEIVREYRPDRIRFKGDYKLVRPVAPFLEVFARTSDDEQALVPLTTTLLKKHGAALKDLSWEIVVGNIKVFRRTGNPDDKIIAKVSPLTDHKRTPLLGHCANFLPGKALPLGWVQFIKPSDKYPQIRLRFTPAFGKVYGSSRTRRVNIHAKDDIPDPIINSDDLVLFDTSTGKSTWRNYADPSLPNIKTAMNTNPASIYAGFSDPDGNQVSWGYIDDECDGTVHVSLQQADGVTLSAHGHIGAGPPAFAPDTLPIRAVSDELEQMLYGIKVQPDEYTLEEAADLVRRGLETVRLLNTTVMNGNPINGRPRVASTMVAQDTNDFERLFAPIAAESLVDNIALRALHERVFSALLSGTAPWFPDLMRKPDEIGDLSDQARRKMPAMMRGADGRGLTFTRRQIDMVIQAASGMTATPATVTAKAIGKGISPGEMKPANLMAQIHYRGGGNPFSVLPRTAISNCFPGLEFDFRNLWRRTFEGIVLIENNNYVIAAEDSKHEDLVGRRLLRVHGFPIMVKTHGPTLPNGSDGTLVTESSPEAVSFMEWSNSLARIMDMQGELVECDFSLEKPATEEIMVTDDTKTMKATLRMRKFFEGKTSAIAKEILQPGELTQGLCSPWQNDYRECACYYWAASRPDYVNVGVADNGLSHGDMWMAKKRTGKYIPDDRVDSRLLSYDDLFREWEQALNFIVEGSDAEESK